MPFSVSFSLSSGVWPHERDHRRLSIEDSQSVLQSPLILPYPLRQPRCPCAFPVQYVKNSGMCSQKPRWVQTRMRSTAKHNIEYQLKIPVIHTMSLTMYLFFFHGCILNCDSRGGWQVIENNRKRMHSSLWSTPFMTAYAPVYWCFVSWDQRLPYSGASIEWPMHLNYFAPTLRLHLSTFMKVIRFYEKFVDRGVIRIHTCIVAWADESQHYVP